MEIFQTLCKTEEWQLGQSNNLGSGVSIDESFIRLFCSNFHTFSFFFQIVKTFSFMCSRTVTFLPWFVNCADFHTGNLRYLYPFSSLFRWTSHPLISCFPIFANTNFWTQNLIHFSPKMFWSFGNNRICSPFLTLPVWLTIWNRCQWKHKKKVWHPKLVRPLRAQRPTTSFPPQ